MTRTSEIQPLNRVGDVAIGIGNKKREEEPCTEACCAGLTGAKMTLEQPEKARSLDETILLDGTKHD